MLLVFMTYVHIFPLVFSSTRKLVGFLLTDNDATRLVVSAHFHSNINRFSHIQYDPTRFGILLIFTLTAAITTSYKQCVEKPHKTTAFLLKHEYTSFV